MKGIKSFRFLAVSALFFCSLLTTLTTHAASTAVAPGAFNLTTVTLSATKAKTLLFSWNKSANAKAYTVCQAKDVAAKNNSDNCKILATNISAITTKYLFSGIADAKLLTAHFFVIAHNARGQRASGSKSITQNKRMEMISSLKATNIDAEDNFGWSVALSADGNIMAVGAPYEASSSQNNPADNSAPKAGAVYLFSRAGNNWSKPVYLKAANIDAGDSFGWSVALSANGDTLAVSAPFEDSGNLDKPADNSVSSSGAVYVFKRNGNSWTQQKYLKASNIGTRDRFGYSLALSADGNTLVSSAFGEASKSQNTPANNSAKGSGAVYVFARNGNSWSKPAYLKATNVDTGDSFGRSVALAADGNTLAVGAYAEASKSQDNPANNSAKGSGAVYVFAHSGSTWLQQKYLKAANIDKNGYFGSSVALSNNGNTLAVSAPFEDSNSPNSPAAGNSIGGSGAVYLFSRAGSSWSKPLSFKAPTSNARGHFGSSITLAADGNTLAVGAYNEGAGSQNISTDTSTNNSAESSGAVYIFSRSSSSSWPQQAYLKAANLGANDYFGWSVALGADGNTLMIGAIGEDSNAQNTQNDNSAKNSGAVYLFGQGVAAKSQTVMKGK